MGRHAQIGHGAISIDTTAWLQQRTGGIIGDLTADLHTWASDSHGGTPSSDDTPTWLKLIAAWCEARHYTSPEPGNPHGGPAFLDLDGTPLTAGVWVVRATAPIWGPVAVFPRGIRPPAVYADTARETADWLDTSVTITCTIGRRHGWIWRPGGDLIDTSGSFTRISDVWGPGPGMPFTPCGTCTAFAQGHRRERCPCDGTSWIVCPMCGARCDVDLPAL